MKSVSGKAFAWLLEQQGWTLLRLQGSHHICGKPGSIARISVPVHGNKPLKIGLLKHLMKIASLSEDDLQRSPSPAHGRLIADFTHWPSSGVLSSCSRSLFQEI